MADMAGSSAGALLLLPDMVLRVSMSLFPLFLPQI
jgi:hypothetical protein